MPPLPEDPTPELSHVLAIMVHDLKNPLAALMTNLYFLVDALGPAGGENAEALGDSVMLCQILERFLKNLDLLARAPDTIGSRRFPITIGSIASEVAVHLRSQAEGAGLELQLGPGISSVSSEANVDRELFQRAIENLVGNAIENAPRGSSVTIDCERLEREVVLTVSDSRTMLPGGARDQERVIGDDEWSVVYGAHADPQTPRETRAVAENPIAEGRRLLSRYGRGLALLSAEIAARAGGGRLEIIGVPGRCRLRLAAPARDHA